MEHSHNEHHEVGVAPQQRRVKDFIPLIVIFSIIIAFTAGMLLNLGRWDTVYAMRNFMGGFFVIFGSFKLLRWKGFVDAYGIYDLIAKRSRLYGYAYPLIELGLGIAYLAAFELLTVNIITFIIMTISALGVANELRKKNRIPCACLGVVFKIPMTTVTLIEDLLMAGMACAMIVIG